MKETSNDPLKFPIGRFSEPSVIEEATINDYNFILATFPQRLKKAVNGLSVTQLDTPYRENGWTIKQLMHHLADSHMNAFIRFKLALTEENPTIKPYEQDAFISTPDVNAVDPMISLKLLEALHHRWTILIDSLSDDQLQRTFFHPELKEKISLTKTLGMYAWHCEHHLAHITELRKRMAW